MEVYFVDVGQGTSNVILLGGSRAIVIDTGKRAADLTKLLDHFQVSKLERLVVSHLDDDHAGGAPAILTEYRGSIGRVCYPNDHRVRQTPFWDKLQAELDDGHLESEQLCRLEYEDRPKRIWHSAALQAELKLFSPTFGENQLAMEAEDTNATSGVLVLKVGSQRIVFPGDSSLEQWQEIRKRKGSPLNCDIIAVPHHAGVIWPSHWADARARTEMQWLYTDAVRPAFAVVSVGTSNTHEHPRPEVMDVLRTLGVKILCSQITSQCASPLEPLRPGSCHRTCPVGQATRCRSPGQATAKTLRARGPWPPTSAPRRCLSGGGDSTGTPSTGFRPEAVRHLCVGSGWRLRPALVMAPTLANAAPKQPRTTTVHTGKRYPIMFLRCGTVSGPYHWTDW